MGLFLKIVSVVYLALVWSGFVMALRMPTPTPLTGYGDEAFKVLLFLGAIGLSLPAAVLFGFGQIVADVRNIRRDIGAMRRYYEPDGR